MKKSPSDGPKSVAVTGSCTLRTPMLHDFTRLSFITTEKKPKKTNSLTFVTVSSVKKRLFSWILVVDVADQQSTRWVVHLAKLFEVSSMFTISTAEHQCFICTI